MEPEATGTRGARMAMAAALVVVAAAVVVDRLVAPAAGVDRLDRPVALLAPLAATGAAAFAVLRLRAGAAAVAGLLLGPPVLVAGAVAVAGAARSGTAAEVAAGALVLTAGAVLAAGAALVLWRSRRRAGRVRLRRALLAAGGALAAAWLVLPVCLAVYATHRPRESTRPADLGRPATEVAIRTADGLTLHGRYVASRNGAAVLTLPSREGTAAHARMLVRHGFGVLQLDLRGRGDSEGDPNAFGWDSVADVRAAVSWLRARPDVRDGRVAGLGLSVGGEVLLEAAATDPGLRAVVSDGAGERSIRETLVRGPDAALVLPMDAVQTLAVAALSGTMPPPSLEDVVGRLGDRPVLLVWAGRGGGGEDLNPSYARAGGTGVRLWGIAEAGHTAGLRARPAEYERRVVGFLDRALSPR